jgi:Protein of unknown function (DUF2569)
MEIIMADVMTGKDRKLVGIRGWLVVYMLALAGLYIFHGPALSIGAIVVYLHPSLAGPHHFLSLNSLLFYVIGNAIEAIYTIVLFILMFRKRKSAIINNVIFNILTVVYLVAWNFLGEKSAIGAVVDSLPGVIGLIYVLRSRRVKNTFVI